MRYRYRCIWMLVAMLMALQYLWGREYRGFHEYELYFNGATKFESLLRAIERAQSSIDIEYFTIRQDSIGRKTLALLQKRASEGVRVRVIYDAFGAMSTDLPLKQVDVMHLSEVGIHLKKFDPIKFPWLNHIKRRDHRKLVVIDNEVAFVGGMNIADYYINGRHDLGEWYDFSLQIRGPIVQGLASAFEAVWSNQLEDVIVEEGNVTAFVDKGFRGKHIIERQYIELIQSAQKQVLIANPYILPTRALTKAIKQASQRGVSVEILTSPFSDIPVTPYAMLKRLNTLRKHGVKVYLYGDGFIHAKLMVVDGRLAMVGSANLNSRSLRNDLELNLLIEERSICLEIDKSLREKMARSTLLDSVYWSSRGCFKNSISHIVNIISPYL